MSEIQCQRCGKDMPLKHQLNRSPKYMHTCATCMRELAREAAKKAKEKREHGTH